MPYLLQISDPDDMRITLQMSGQYQPDILDDLKRRVVDLYKEALAARFPDTHKELAAQPAVFLPPFFTEPDDE